MARFEKLLGKVTELDDAFKRAVDDMTDDSPELSEGDLFTVHISAISSFLAAYLERSLKGQDRLTTLDEIASTVRRVTNVDDVRLH